LVTKREGVQVHEIRRAFQIIRDAMNTIPPVQVRPEIADAIRTKCPVIAMTTAALAHSLPWPENLEIARLAEASVSQEGAKLAFVGVWAGILTVGLSSSEIESLCKGGSSARANRRDLGAVVLRRATAATTVSASLYLAQQAGIRILVAGAIGGVSFRSTKAWDVASDLVEIARTPVAVVTSGTRSQLDLDATAEALESFSVPVIGYETNALPVFGQRSTNEFASVRTESPADAAALLSSHWRLSSTGVVVANPTPASAALSADELYPALAELQKQAAEAKLHTRDLPQFLLTRLNRLTGGRALRAYRSSFETNSRLAARIGREFVQHHSE
jgi:pseudouridine-5'-phosphate glycosidase